MSSEVVEVPNVMRPLLLRMTEAAQLAAISRSSAYELSRGEWRPFVITVGKSRRVVFAGLMDWIRRKQEAPI